MGHLGNASSSDGAQDTGELEVVVYQTFIHVVERKAITPRTDYTHSDGPAPSRDSRQDSKSQIVGLALTTIDSRPAQCAGMLPTHWLGHDGLGLWPSGRYVQSRCYA